MNRIQRLFMGTGSNMGIIVTAWREALLAGVQEVTPDHLLTALAVSGGPAAELLARHGVTVARGLKQPALAFVLDGDRRRLDAVERGFVLTCQTYPVGDEVTVDFDA